MYMAGWVYVIVLQLLCVPIGGRHFGSRPALESLKDTLRTFCAAPALMPKYAYSSRKSISQSNKICIAPPTNSGRRRL